jgi:p-aminobenzoyl-glutamate transporter AbgT
MNLFIILYLVGFLRTVFFIAIIYFVIRLFTRYLLPKILETKIHEMEHKMKQQQKQQERSGKREGDVTIEYNREQNNIRDKEKGEYIDFEEVE